MRILIWRTIPVPVIHKTALISVVMSTKRIGMARRQYFPLLLTVCSTLLIANGDLVRNRSVCSSFKHCVCFDDGDGDDDDDEYTNMTSVSCSFYSYIPHFPSPSFTILTTLSL